MTRRSTLSPSCTPSSPWGSLTIERSNCFDVEAAVLALGNRSFELIAGAKDDVAQAHITAATAPYLATAAALLGCEPAHIISYEKSLTSWQATKA
eukprot:14675-Heterococcus_DN1.PRE.8